MPVSETYRGYRIQIVLVPDQIRPRNRPSGPWIPEVRIYWKENGDEKHHVFRVDYSSKREREAENVGIARGKTWVDQREVDKAKT